MKHFSAVCKAAVLLLVLALPAVASAPIITATPFVAFVQPSVPAFPGAPAGCPSFAVYLAPQQGRPNKGTTITFANGSTVSHGATFVTATNLNNLKSINLNISGPGQFSVSDNTFTVFGPSLDIGFQGFGPADLPSNIVLLKGQAVLQFDNSVPPNVISVSYTGAPPLDVCQALE